MITQILEQNKDASFEEKVVLYNKITKQLYEFMGLDHPALNIQLVPMDSVEGNDYNPNKVAPPEMKLLELSIRKDGLTMPVVVATEKKDGNWIVVDGFHLQQPVKIYPI